MLDSTLVNSSSEEEIWLVCPICMEPNSAGTPHCRFCWGAALYSVKPITNQELAEVTRRKVARARRLNLLRIISVSIFAPLLLSLAVFIGLYNFTDAIFKPDATLNSSSLPGEWSMFRRDLSRSGSASLLPTQPQGTLKWTFSTDAPIHSSPAVVNGTVYFGSRDWTLYAVDAETGTKRWEFKAESWIESSPTVVNGIVYFGSNDGRLYALDADTGQKLWDYKTRYAVKTSPAVADGIVYIGGDDYYIHAFDAVTGTLLWEFETGSHIASSPAVANGIVYIGSNDGYIYGLNAKNGRFRLRFKPYQAVMSSPSVSDGVVYVNSGGYLYAIDGSARNWPGEYDFRGWWLQFYAFRLAPSPPPISGFMWRQRLGRASSSSSPIVIEDTIYTCADNRMYAIDTETREVQWWFIAGDTLRSSPALGNNVVYVGSEDGNLYAVDATSGTKIWDFATGDQITSSPALVGSTVYVGSHDGKLYAIE